MTLKDAELRLAEAGIDSPEWDARELYLFVTGKPRQDRIDKAKEIDDPRFWELIARRCGREPLQYILGEVYFYREKYFVNPNVLIPRQDTEHLVDYAVKHIPSGEFFLDLCTGSGCIAISVLNNTQHTEALAVDISDAALKLAKKNAEYVGVADRLNLLKCDLLSSFPTLGRRPYAILSNPPYVTREAYAELDPEIYREPECAFVAEREGMEFYERLLPISLDSIDPFGFVAFEIGYDQKEKITALADKLNANTEIIYDYSGNARVAVIRRQ